MKSNTLTPVMLFPFIFCLLPYFLSAQWYSQESGIISELNSIYFTNSQNGWAVGREGIILHTDDGGDNWDAQSCDINDCLNEVFFMDSNQGWIAGGPGAGLGIIYHTVNGGVNWDVLYSDTINLPAPIYFNDVCFTDADNGWAVGYGSWFMHTDDGGETWDYQGFLEDYTVSSIQFLDSLRGWAVGGKYYCTGQYQCTILSTNNGGNTWTEQINTYGTPPLKDVYFTDTLNGYAAGGGLIHKTSNGGISWNTSYSNSGFFYLLFILLIS